MGDSNIEAFRLAEFTALRAEILQRAQFQQQLVSLSVVAAGTLFTVYLQFHASVWILMIYPLLAMFMAIEWSFNNNRIMQIGHFIQEEVEDAWAEAGWESFLRSDRARTRLSPLSGTPFAYGTFMVLPFLVVTSAITTGGFSWNLKEIVFLVVDAAIVLAVVPLIVHASEDRPARSERAS